MDSDRFGTGRLVIEGRCISSKVLLQRLRLSTSHRTNRICSPEVVSASSEVLPKMGQMIDSVWIDSLLHCLYPLLVRNLHIANRPAERSANGFDNLARR